MKTFTVELTDSNVMNMFRMFGKYIGEYWVITNSKGRFEAIDYQANGGIKFYQVGEVEELTPEEAFRGIANL